MVRETTYFACEKCGKIFKGPDIEYNATSKTQPINCPDCGSLCQKASVVNTAKAIVKKIETKKEEK